MARVNHSEEIVSGNELAKRTSWTIQRTSSNVESRCIQFGRSRRHVRPRRIGLPGSRYRELYFRNDFHIRIGACVVGKTRLPDHRRTPIRRRARRYSRWGREDCGGHRAIADRSSEQRIGTWIEPRYILVRLLVTFFVDRQLRNSGTRQTIGFGICARVANPHRKNVCVFWQLHKKFRRLEDIPRKCDRRRFPSLRLSAKWNVRKRRAKPAEIRPDENVAIGGSRVKGFQIIGKEAGLHRKRTPIVDSRSAIFHRNVQRSGGAGSARNERRAGEHTQCRRNK